MSWKVKVTDNGTGQSFERQFEKWSDATDKMIEFEKGYLSKGKAVDIALYTPEEILLYTLKTKDDETDQGQILQ